MIVAVNPIAFAASKEKLNNKIRTSTMTQVYKGSLSLEWYNKQKSIITQGAAAPAGKDDIPAPMINWINKDQSLFYEIDEKEGKGLKPYWVDRNDIRVKETRPLVFQKAYKAVPKSKDLTGQSIEYKLVESKDDDPEIENILIRGDNLLALNTLKKMFDQKPEVEKVKCIYIDPPYNTGTAFDHYDDNIAHSEWLTLMRDRLILLRSLLRYDGFVFVQLDDKESHYGKVLMDEIFGRDNFRNSIYWKRTYAGKTVSKNLPSNVDTILLYSKTPDTLLNQVTAELTEKDIASYNKDDGDGRGKYATVSMQKTGNPTKGTVFDYTTNDGRIYERPDKGWRMVFEKMKALENDNRLYFTESTIREKYYLSERLKIGKQIDNFWSDIGNLNRNKKEETGFTGGQKPEALIERIINLCTSEGDVVFDCFGGSGTTYSVAHKLGRLWVGVEIGKHADTLITPRMKKVLDGSDQNGPSKTVGWQGGGSFKYYHIGPSIIQVDKYGKGDFYWELGRQFIEGSLLSSYDYTLDGDVKLPKTALFEADAAPSIGINKVGTKTDVALCSLNEPGGPREMMTNQEIRTLYNILKEKHKPEFITIFTNRGVELALEAKPDDLEIIKVPHAIFAELEK
jgi:adenine-specific DNA-methyltransferase